MDGKAIKLIKYLDGSEKRFIIPVYLELSFHGI